MKFNSDLHILIEVMVSWNSILSHLASSFLTTISFFSSALEPIVQTNPCVPSPCGPNAECRVVGDSPSCSCLPEFLGLPPNCRPECVSNSECPSHLACINQKCRDPCEGSCGANAECRVVSHTPMCVCPSDFTGDPFTQCTIKQRKHRLILLSVHSTRPWKTRKTFIIHLETIEMIDRIRTKQRVKFASTRADF